VEEYTASKPLQITKRQSKKQEDTDLESIPGNDLCSFPETKFD
jgi:hypothetical protein